MTRRFAVLVGALVAAASFSSCSTFDRQDTAAAVNGVELSVDTLNSMLDEKSDADGASAQTPSAVAERTLQERTVLSTWIQVQVATGGKEGITTLAALQAAVDEMLAAQTDAAMAETEARYNDDPAHNDVLCLAGFPMDAAADPSDAIAAVASGTPFAEVIAQYSIAPEAATSGGVIVVDGNECPEAATMVPELISDIEAAAPEIGEAFTTSLNGYLLVLVMRPFTDLTAETKAALALPVAQANLPNLFVGTEVWVNSSYGAWDADAFEVAPFGN